MDVVLLLLMAAPGLFAGRQYHFITEPKTFSEAQSYCREKHTDLATIENLEEAETLNTMAASRGITGTPWIGLYDDVNSWRWSLSDTSFYQLVEEEFRGWDDGQPGNYRSTEHCTEMNRSGRWNDQNCKVIRRAVCCDVTGLDVTFNLTDASMTWTEAQSYCREHHTDLASVRDLTENQRVQDLVPGDRVWIGLFRDSWKWSDGSNSSFTYWIPDPAQPDNSLGNQACAAANFGVSGRWGDRSCDIKLPFICYDPAPTNQVIRVRLQRKSSSLDLNDPAVMEATLQQLQHKLKDQGLNGDVRLSWRKQADGKVFHKEEKKDQL